MTGIRAKECKLASLWLDAFSSCSSVLFLILSTGRGQYMTICLQNAGYTCLASNVVTVMICHVCVMFGHAVNVPVWLQTWLHFLLLFFVTSNNNCFQSTSASFLNKLEMWFHFIQCWWEIHTLGNLEGYCRKMLSMCLSIIEVDHVKCALKP